MLKGKGFHKHIVRAGVMRANHCTTSVLFQAPSKEVTQKSEIDWHDQGFKFFSWQSIHTYNKNSAGHHLHRKHKFRFYQKIFAYNLHQTCPNRQSSA